MAIIKTRRPIFAISLQNLHIYEEKVGQKVGQKWAKSGPNGPKMLFWPKKVGQK